MKQRILVILTALLLMLAPVASMGEATVPESGLTVGTITPMSGEFFLDIWGNNTVDIDVRHLLQGYRTVAGVETADRKMNADVLASMTSQKDRRGNKVYTLTLKDGLLFSDGKEVTAKDYVLTLLLQYHPLMRELGAVIEPMREIVGGMNFQNGKTAYVEGVHLVNEKTFSVTLAKNVLPDFNELRFVDLFPTPLHALLPQTDIADNGKGVQFTEALTVDMLKAALDGENGYRSHPEVVSGPYKLVSYQGTEVEFVRNEHYQGKTPAIERIHLIHVPNEQVVDALKTGKVQLMNKVSAASVLSELKNAQGLKNAVYPRTGLAYLAFNFEHEAVKKIAVRKAIAHAIDRNTLISEFLGANGVNVEGYYGAGQWMARHYQKLGGDQIKGYAYDMKKAEGLLKGAGYSAKKPLKLAILIPENNQVAEALVESLSKALAQVNVELTVDRKPFTEVLQQYYHQSERSYDMVFMATNFDPYFEPTLQFAREKDMNGRLNFSEIDSKALLDAAKTMRATDPDKADLYYKRWVAFQRAFNNVLPVIPLYSNYYTDVYSENLTGYDITMNVSWADAIVHTSYAN